MHPLTFRKPRWRWRWRSGCLSIRGIPSVCLQKDGSVIFTRSRKWPGASSAWNPSPSRRVEPHPCSHRSTNIAAQTDSIAVIRIMNDYRKRAFVLNFQSLITLISQRYLIAFCSFLNQPDCAVGVAPALWRYARSVAWVRFSHAATWPCKLTVSLRSGR
jgi:hypothetical protein